MSFELRPDVLLNATELLQSHIKTIVEESRARLERYARLPLCAGVATDTTLLTTIQRAHAEVWYTTEAGDYAALRRGLLGDHRLAAKAEHRLLASERGKLLQKLL